MPTAAPAEPAQQPAADQPIVAPVPAAQPGHDAPKPVVPVLDAGTPKPRTVSETPVVPSPSAPTAPIFTPPPSDLKPAAPAPAPAPEPVAGTVGIVTTPVPVPAPQPSNGSLFGGR
jgi:hypothetical protein